MLRWMESRWRHQEGGGGGHPGQQYGEQQCCRGWCSWEMSDSNHSIPDKAAERPVRINANKSGMWAGMPCAIESNFYILERQPSDTILDTGRQHSEQTRGLRNSVKLVPDYPTPQGWQFSNFVSGSCRGCQETPVCRCVRNTVFVSSAVSSQLCGTGPGSADRRSDVTRVRISCKSVLRGGRRVSDAPSATMDWQTASDTSRSV